MRTPKNPDPVSPGPLKTATCGVLIGQVGTELKSNLKNQKMPHRSEMEPRCPGVFGYWGLAESRATMAFRSVRKCEGLRSTKSTQEGSFGARPVYIRIGVVGERILIM